VIVLDTGPLYAAADRSDAHHDECASVLEDLERPLVIPVTVVIETSYLVEHRLGPDAEARFLTEFLGEDYRVEQLTAGDLRRMAELVHRYADMPLGAVDASVVAIAERLGVSEVVTLDRRHFSVVRPAHTGAFTLLP
jgi:predicted nucleic acid-binding protein